jgi:hypothetical protein
MVSQAHERKGLMDQIITGVVDHTIVPVTSFIAWSATNGLLLAVFGAIWVALGVGIILSQASVDQTWQWIRGLPLIAQAVVWLLFLPIVAGLWIWETTWPLLVRLVLVMGLAGWNILVFIPRAVAKG